MKGFSHARRQERSCCFAKTKPQEESGEARFIMGGPGRRTFLSQVLHFPHSHRGMVICAAPDHHDRAGRSRGSFSFVDCLPIAPPPISRSCSPATAD